MPMVSSPHDTARCCLVKPSMTSPSTSSHTRRGCFLRSRLCTIRDACAGPGCKGTFLTGVNLPLQVDLAASLNLSFCGPCAFSTLRQKYTQEMKKGGCKLLFGSVFHKMKRMMFLSVPASLWREPVLEACILGEICLSVVYDFSSTHLAAVYAACTLVFP